jgi:EmrB/QacA subfamily drug resistance transporter
MALGVWGAVSGSGGAAGVLLGGVLTSTLSWSWIFYINVPIGIVVLVLGQRILVESRADLDHRHFDTAGASTITGGLMLLVYGLTHGSQHGWTSPETIAVLTGAAALVIVFVVIELRSKAPLLPMRIFRMRTLTASNVTSLFSGATVFSQFFLLTLYMQQVLGYSALQTGVAYLAFTLAVITFAPLAQSLSTRIGIRPIVPAGLLLASVALLLDARLPAGGHYFWDIFPTFVLGGIGLALTFVPLSIGALAGVEASDAGVASGLLNTTQQIGGAIGVAVATTVATTFTRHYVESHASVGALDPAALTHGFQVAFVVLAGITIAAAVIAAVMIESKPPLTASDGADQSFDGLEPATEAAA